MGEIGKIEIDGKQTIGNALSKARLQVPINQRTYRWEARNAQELFDDIEYAMGEDDSQYFLGSIVVTETDSDRHSVVDGQQRLATTLMFIAAIRDYLHELGGDDAGRAGQLSEEFLISRDFDTQEWVQRFVLSEKDDDFFRKRVLLAPTDSERILKLAPKELKKLRNSHKRIDAAARIAAAQVKKIAAAHNGNDNQSTALRGWIKFLKKGVRVIWVSVQDEANAFVMFETLNDRGLQLSKADLLKNYLFGRSQTDLSVVQPKWASMTGAIESVGDEALVVTYIRQFWSSHYGPTRERDLFVKIKDRVKSKPESVALATQLADNATLYAALLSSSHEKWNEYGPTARRNIDILNTLQMEQVRPLLLAILNHMTAAEVQKCLRFLVRCSVRFLIVGGLGGGAMESQYAERAMDIRSGKIKVATDLLKKMKTVVPNDAIFSDSFATARVSKSHIARYYLSIIEQQKGKKPKEPELVPNTNQEQVNLEHIMPEKLSPAWSHIKAEDHDAYCTRLGNLTLLANTPNSKGGNDDFATVKKPIYKDSDFGITKDIAKKSKWDIAAIEARQEKLAELAVKAWPLKVT